MTSARTSEHGALYGFYGSFCTQKAQLALAEKGVVLARITVNIGPPMENYRPWYASLNPQMVVPTLVHRGHIVCDSRHIIRYIDETFPGPKLTPAHPSDAAEVARVCDEIDALPIRLLTYASMVGGLRLLRDRLVMPRRLKLLRANRRRAPELREAYDRRIDDVVEWMAALRRPPAIAAADRRLHDCLADLDARANAGPFLIGDTYSLADLMATVLCARLRAMGLAALESYPDLEVHYARMRARPRFPSHEIVEKVSAAKMLRIFGPFLAPRLAALSVVLGAPALLWLWGG
ncbi:MAG: glutathione S-transferase family protein [Myxococcota bacterium]